MEVFRCGKVATFTHCKSPSSFEKPLNWNKLLVPGFSPVPILDLCLTFGSHFLVGNNGLGSWPAQKEGNFVECMFHSLINWHSYKKDTFHNEKKGTYSKETIVQTTCKHTVPKLACLKEAEDAAKSSWANEKRKGPY